MDGPRLQTREVHAHERRDQYGALAGFEIGEHAVADVERALAAASE